MATGTAPTRHQALAVSLATPTDKCDGNWRPCGRLDGSEYYVKTRLGGDDPFEPSALVVDHWGLTTVADNTADSLPSCEEAYLLGEDKWLLVLHSSQIAWYPWQHGNGLDMKTKRKLYWTYIAAHPAHAGGSMANWIAEAHKQALAFLKWCSFEAMTSPLTAKVPFALTASQELANMLASLYEKSAYSKDGEEDAAADIQGVLGTQLIGPALPHLVDDHPVPGAETAAQESLKLRTALIAKVLAAKYSQQAALDTSVVRYNHHTSAHRGIALVVGLPLAAFVFSLPSSGGRLSLTEPSGVFYAVVATVAVGMLARYSLAGLWGYGHGHRAAGAVESIT